MHLLAFSGSVFHPFRPHSSIPTIFIQSRPRYLSPPAAAGRQTTACIGDADGAKGVRNFFSFTAANQNTDRPDCPFTLRTIPDIADFCLPTDDPVPAVVLPSLHTKRRRPRPPPLWAAVCSGSTVHACPEPSPHTWLLESSKPSPQGAFCTRHTFASTLARLNQPPKAVSPTTRNTTE